MTHQPLPVQGYTPQSQAKVDLVNENKVLEEQVLRQLDRLATITGVNGEPISIDKRWLAIAPHARGAGVHVCKS